MNAIAMNSELRAPSPSIRCCCSVWLSFVSYAYVLIRVKRIRLRVCMCGVYAGIASRSLARWN